MISAIISDSLLFKSPTCTDDEDVNAAKDLKDLANVDLDEYGLEMLKLVHQLLINLQRNY